MNNKFKCPCCGQMTLEDERENDICQVCGWEDDWWDSNNPDDLPSCNWLSLNQARQIYKETGVNILEIQKLKKRNEINDKLSEALGKLQPIKIMD